MSIVEQGSDGFGL